MLASAEEKRIWMVDIARFYAMALVFYGHFIERVMILENAAAAVQYKFIYSFHMVLFVILAGYVARERDVEAQFRAYLKTRVFSRLPPSGSSRRASWWWIRCPAHSSAFFRSASSLRSSACFCASR
jgi:hypothetical protein